MKIFALTIFAGAFLLFQVQPLIAKFILPWFGGVPAVWTTCMLFFQVFLLAGYAYAHLTARYLSHGFGSLLPKGLARRHVKFWTGQTFLWPRRCLHDLSIQAQCRLKS